MKPEIIEIEKYTKTRDEWGYLMPFTIAYLYTQYKFFIIKGMYPSVSKYIRENFTHKRIKAIWNTTHWHDGCRSKHWNSNLAIYFSPAENEPKRIQIMVFPPKGTCLHCGSKDVEKPMQQIIVRRIPDHWIPLYNEADFRGEGF